MDIKDSRILLVDDEKQLQNMVKDISEVINEFKENGSAQDDKNKEFESAVTPLEQIQETVINLIAENEELTLGQVGSTLGNHFSDFDVRNYGYTKLSVMIKEEFHKIKLTKSTESNNIYYVKNKVNVITRNAVTK